MRLLSKNLLVVALVAAGIPHAWCNCQGCYGTAPAAAASGCPRCDEGERTGRPELPRKPCSCGSCQMEHAVRTAGPSMQPGRVHRVDSLPDQLVHQSCSVDVFSPRQLTQLVEKPSQWVSGCALPILLGHLLF